MNPSRQAAMYRRVAAGLMARRETERRTLALTLHEDLGQRLSALKMDLAALQAGEPGPERAQRLAAMQDLVGSAVSTLRRISSELCPLMLDDLGLQAAADWLLQDLSARQGVVVSLDFPQIEPPLADLAAVAVYRMLQDMLDHLVDDRQAAAVDVSLSRRSPGLWLDVQGRGGVCGGSAQASAALTTLRECALVSGWTFTPTILADGGLRLRAGLGLRRDPASGRLQPRSTAGPSA